MQRRSATARGAGDRVGSAGGEDSLSDAFWEDYMQAPTHAENTDTKGHPTKSGSANVVAPALFAAAPTTTLYRKDYFRIFAASLCDVCAVLPGVGWCSPCCIGGGSGGGISGGGRGTRPGADGATMAPVPGVSPPAPAAGSGPRRWELTASNAPQPRGLASAARRGRGVTGGAAAARCRQWLCLPTVLDFALAFFATFSVLQLGVVVYQRYGARGWWCRKMGREANRASVGCAKQNARR